MGSIAAKPSNHAADGYYVWTAEGKPVSVHLSLGVVRRLESQLTGDAPAGERRPETGGLLLGRVRQVSADYWLVSVDAFEPIAIEHVRGASWILSTVDKRRLAAALRKHGKAGRDGLQPVGWFRSHTRPGLFLDQHDFEIFQGFFPDETMVALVIRPEEDAPATAGFFFWEDGDVHRSTSYCHFPFRAEALAASSLRLPIPIDVRTPSSSLPARRQPADVVVQTRRLPAPPPPHRGASFDWRKLVLWVPVAVGLAAAVFWNPSPFPRQQRNRAETPVPSSADTAPRVTFAAPEPPIAVPAVEQRPPSPAPKARTTPAPRRQLRAAVPPRRAVPSPQLLADLPPVPVASVPAPGAAALKLEPAPYLATATVEPARVSGLRRAVGSIPGLGFLKRKNKNTALFVPARPIRQIRPPSPSTLSEDVPVRVKLLVSESGDVVSAELVGRRVDPQLANLAVDAASRWKFAPATEADTPVETEVVVQFHFGPRASDL